MGSSRRFRAKAGTVTAGGCRCPRLLTVTTESASEGSFERMDGRSTRRGAGSEAPEEAAGSGALQNVEHGVTMSEGSRSAKSARCRTMCSRSRRSI